MKALGLKCLVRLKKYKSHWDSMGKIADNVLKLFNAEITLYTIVSKQTYSLFSRMLQNVVSKLLEAHLLLIHSDQGWYCQMKPFRQTLKAKGIVQSTSRNGNCHNNPVMGNFFKIMKCEFLCLNRFESIALFKVNLANYIDDYKARRIKSKLKLSPVQFRTQFAEATQMK